MVCGEITLWVLWGLLGGTYVLYPLILSRYSSPGQMSPRQEYPPLTVLITARNEAACIEQKIANVQQARYPQERLRIVVVSDGSVDQTVALASGREGVEVVALEEPLGKTGAAMAALERVDTPLVAFTDATGMLHPDALTRLVEALAEEDVVCAGGRILYTYGSTPEAQGFRSYQGIARSLRSAESRLGAATVISGALHACTRELLVPIPSDLSYELALPFEASAAGKRSRYVPEALCTENARRTSRGEWRARVRMGIRSWRFLFYALSRVFEIRSLAYAVHLFFHKVMRWIGGPILLALMFLSILGAGESAMATVTLGLGGGLVFCAALSGVFPWRLFGICRFFLLVNAAYCWSLVCVLMGRRAPGWEPEREL